MPEDIEFLTEPALATGMLTRALNAVVPARWVAGDEVYGADPGPARRVGGLPSRVRVGDRCDRRVPTEVGLLRADELTARLPKHAWQRISAWPGAKGQRFYDWALVTLTPPETSDNDTACWWMLVRRHPRAGELAFYRCYYPDIVPLRELVRVAGRRWTVEESFQAA